MLAHNDLGQHDEAGAKFEITPDGVAGSLGTTSREFRKLNI